MKINFVVFGLIGIFILFLFGCIGSNSNNSSNDLVNGVITVTSNQNVFVEIIPNGATSGTAPLSPDFRYSCTSNDPTTLCTMIIDGKTFVDQQVPPYPDLTSTSWPVFSAGNHVVEITATNQKGEKTTKRLIYTVSAANSVDGPVAEIYMNKTSGRVPFYLDFTYDCYDPSGKTLNSCKIQADGQPTVVLDHPQTLDWPENVIWDYYRDPGTYSATITATAEDGKVSTKSAKFTVTDEIPAYVQEYPKSFDPKYKSAINDAFTYWESVHKIRFTQVPNLANDPISADWTKEYQGETIGRAEIAGRHLIIGLGDSECNGKFQYYDYDSVVNLAEHELGHILGYEHTNDTKSIMYPIILGLKYEIDVNEELIVPDGWTYYYPTCTRKTDPTNYRVEITSDKPVNIYLVPSKVEYEKSLNGELFSFDRECHSDQTTSFDKICDFNSRDYLILINNERGLNDDAARVNLKLIEQ